jgi:hypothetical protein
MLAPLGKQRFVGCMESPECTIFTGCRVKMVPGGPANSWPGRAATRSPTLRANHLDKRGSHNQPAMPAAACTNPTQASLGDSHHNRSPGQLELSSWSTPRLRVSPPSFVKHRVARPTRGRVAQRQEAPPSARITSRDVAHTTNLPWPEPHAQIQAKPALATHLTTSRPANANPPLGTLRAFA